MEALAFPRGNVYLIICKEGDQALKLDQTEPKKFEDSRFTVAKSNAQDIRQLFMIEKVGLKEDEYQIVNFQSSLVWTESGEEIQAQKGKQSAKQLFFVNKAPVAGYFPFFWFKTSAKGDEALAFEGILRRKPFDPNIENQLFRFELANNSPIITQSAIILNNMSGKAIDVPGATFDKGEKIIVYEKNKRSNQRWRTVKSTYGITIVSVLNGLCLDINEGKKDPDTRIIIWESNGGANQQWIPEAAGAGIFKLRSAHAKDLFLSLRGDSVDDGAKLIVTNKDSPAALWRFEGAQP